MIYTITTNPSLDYYLSFRGSLKGGENNRSDFELYDAGGKGVNVSIFLNSMNIQSTALGFLGGFTADFYLEHLKKYPRIQPMFTGIRDNTRINIKIMSDDEYSLNAKGPHITDEEFARFFKRIAKIYDDDSLVLSGNVQEELRDKMCDLVHELSDEGTRIILDTDLEIYHKCTGKRIFLIKLNDSNAGTNEADIISTCRYMCQNNTRYVMYSSPVHDYYYLISKDEVLKSKKPEGYSATTGSGDATIAGFLYATMRGANKDEAFKYAISFSENLKLCADPADKDLIDSYADNIVLEKI